MYSVFNVLDALGIAYVHHEHEPFFTCKEAEGFYADHPGGHYKSLFLRNKTGDKHYLYLLEKDKRADLKALAQRLNESKLSFGSAERLMEVLKLTPGSVSPFGLIHDDESKKVTVLVDADLKKEDTVYFHPNINTSTLEISSQDFLKFLESLGYSPVVI